MVDAKDDAEVFMFTAYGGDGSGPDGGEGGVVGSFRNRLTCSWKR